MGGEKLQTENCRNSLKRLKFQATFTGSLTAGVDNTTGGAGDDTIVGDLAFNNTTAAYDTPTLGVFDVIVDANRNQLLNRTLYL